MNFVVDWARIDLPNQLQKMYLGKNQSPKSVTGNVFGQESVSQISYRKICLGKNWSPKSVTGNVFYADCDFLRQHEGTLLKMSLSMLLETPDFGEISLRLKYQISPFKYEFGKIQRLSQHSFHQNVSLIRPANMHKTFLLLLPLLFGGVFLLS